jgi:hypothetical protein
MRTIGTIAGSAVTEVKAFENRHHSRLPPGGAQ